jgi:branched-chain amino acid transport system ATP-binding protein
LESDTLKKEARVLHVKDLEAGYGRLQVLWGISLRVADGEFVGLLGPNGAGKTTTLRSIAGMLTPTSGEVKFRGESVTGLPAHTIHGKGLSLVPEDLHLFSDMTVRENLLLGAYGRPAAARRRSLDNVLELFPRLADRQRQLAGTLSGGERKMLALGRGLMADPDILLVDEPSLGLAPRLASAVLEALVALNDEGVTILLVEQNVFMTLKITDRSYILEQGRILLEGPSSELMHNPHVQDAYLAIEG